MQRKVKVDNNEPTESKFDLPSEKEHCLQITDCSLVDGTGTIYSVKLEVIGSDEAGRTLLNRINIDESQKSFYYCRLFLKAIGCEYKGEFTIDPDEWVGRQAYANIIHNGKYANIDSWNFDKIIKEQPKKPVAGTNEEIAW